MAKEDVPLHCLDVEYGCDLIVNHLSTVVVFYPLYSNSKGELSINETPGWSWGLLLPTG